jgi:hypothetical protein
VYLGKPRYHLAVDERSDLDQLRGDFPGWQFGTIWVTAASRPDARRVYAQRNGVLLTAWTTAQLAADIRDEEQSS